VAPSGVKVPNSEKFWKNFDPPIPPKEFSPSLLRIPHWHQRLIHVPTLLAIICTASLIITPPQCTSTNYVHERVTIVHHFQSISPTSPRHNITRALTYSLFPVADRSLQLPATFSDVSPQVVAVRQAPYPVPLCLTWRFRHIQGTFQPSRRTQHPSSEGCHQKKGSS
jgi:hypothetical protein